MIESTRVCSKGGSSMLVYFLGVDIISRLSISFLLLFSQQIDKYH